MTEPITPLRADGGSLPDRVHELLAEMRTNKRWPHAYGSLDVVYANDLDDWLDELAALLAPRGETGITDDRTTLTTTKGTE